MMPGTVARLAGARRRWRTWLNQNADWPLLHTEVPLVHAAEYGMSQPVGGCFPPVLHGVSGSATPVSGAAGRPGARHNSLPTNADCVERPTHHGVPASPSMALRDGGMMTLAWPDAVATKARSAAARSVMENDRRVNNNFAARRPTRHVQREAHSAQDQSTEVH